MLGKTYQLGNRDVYLYFLYENKPCQIEGQQQKWLASKNDTLTRNLEIDLQLYLT